MNKHPRSAHNVLPAFRPAPSDRRFFPFSIFHFLFSLFRFRRSLALTEAEGSPDTQQEVHIIEILP
jgi:hypothetical protein